MKKIDNFLKRHYRFVFLLCVALIIISFSIDYFVYSTVANGDANVYKNNISSYVMNEMNSMDARYSYSIGWLTWMLSFAAVVVGFYSYQQWKLTNNQKEELEKEINNRYGINKMRKKLRKAQKYNNTMKHLISKSQKKIDKLKKDTISFNLESAAHMAETMEKDDDVIIARNKLLLLYNLLCNYEDEEIDNQAIEHVMICLANGIDRVYDLNFKSQSKSSDFYIMLKTCKDTLLSKLDDKYKNDDECTNFKQTMDKILVRVKK